MLFSRVQDAAVPGLQVKLLPIKMPCILIKAEEVVYMEATLFKTTKMCRTFFSHIDSYQFWKENNMHTNKWTASLVRKECVNFSKQPALTFDYDGEQLCIFNVKESKKQT